MALAFGGGVRPELGRTDYTSFLQGSLAGSQMAARGGESIGKALAGLGQDLAAGVEKYQENKNITAEMLGSVEGIISAYPEAVENVPDNIAPLLKKLVDNGTVNQREAMTLNGYFSGQQKTIESKMKQDLAAAQADEARARAQQLQALAANQENARKQDEAFSRAIATGRPAGGGDVDYAGAADRYFELGGTDVERFNQLMQIENPDNFEAKAGKVTLDDGSIVLGTYTSKGQFQVNKVLGKDGRPMDRELSRVDKLRIRLGEINEALRLGLMSNEEAEEARKAARAKEFNLPQTKEDPNLIKDAIGRNNRESPNGDVNFRFDPKTGLQPKTVQPIPESQPFIADEGEFNFSDAFRSGLEQPSAAMFRVPNFNLGEEGQSNNVDTPSALADRERVYRMLANLPPLPLRPLPPPPVPINPNAIRPFLPGPSRNF
jgi:hypothetical protein